MLWLLAAALAAPPDKTATLISVGTSDGGVDRLRNLHLSADGRLVVGKTGASGLGFVLDVEEWTIQTWDDCTVKGVVADATSTSSNPGVLDYDYELWYACDDGTIRAKTYVDGALSDLADEDGATISLDVGDAPSGLWTDGVGYLFTVGQEQGVGSTAHVISIDSLGVDASAGLGGTWPSSLTTDGFKDAVVSEFADALVVAHGSSDQSILYLSTGGWNLVPRAIGGLLLDCDDLAPSRVSESVYCVQESGNYGIVAELIPTTGVSFQLFLGDLNEPQAIVVSDDLDSSWMAVTGGQVKVFETDEQETPLNVDNPYFVGIENANNQIQDMVTRDGYLFGGGVAGNMHIVTANPWMYPAKASAALVDGAAVGATGDEVELRFTWDEDVDWSLYRGGNRFEAGDLLTTSSEVLPAETEAVVSVTIDDTWDEGDNGLYVYGESTRTGSPLIGYGRVEISVDNPPKPPTLDESSVSFANGALFLGFDGISDADLSHYELYVTVTPFDGADYPTGGPAFDGDTALVTPIRLDFGPSERVDYEVEPLENDVTYYMAVRAFDTGGKEGVMSAVVSGVPKETFSASDLAGDPGGTPCSTRPGAALGSMALLGLLSLRRRRRALAAAAVVGMACALPQASLAADDDEDPWWKADQTPARGDFEIRYGVIELDDENLNAVYNQNPTNLLQAEFGPQFFRVAEVDFGIGFFQELANTVTEDGEVSGERSMLTWWPLALDGTLRLHILDEQPLVPFVRYGFDYIIYTEEKEVGATRQKTQGGRFGSHYSLGVNLLLDLFQPGRASMLEARSGINDSWLTFEWRRQAVDFRSAPWGAPVTNNRLSFGGDAIMVGLKLDY